MRIIVLYSSTFTHVYEGNESGRRVWCYFCAGKLSMILILDEIKSHAKGCDDEQLSDQLCHNFSYLCTYSISLPSAH
ncbi:hypothetical protein CY34DRAFT_390477 [Suillus luteus UH-Slu-Lm8-n1]|uniref:Uncharacterized protein n=1 Tax=Suillus luteus UH-Slu-Lm8-n1 TaxID=930992 RepID=A0A0D0BA40_9AGAM|nr:hypothetical protein CY34DRAFT_390477 [Suillus luteus UH-Slu-Lm8-n1]